MRLFLLLALATLVVAPRTVTAQRTLGWREVAVDARLDSTGRLHVRERQAMVFTGEWNGGERVFNIRPGQSLDFGRMLRVDAATGAERAMQRGDLDEVDHFDFTDASTLRWRSRRASDPPFANTEITYVLEYTFANILVPRGDTLVLDHDFAFANREANIDRFTLTLALDPIWGAPADFAGSYSAAPLVPGRGYVVTVPLTYRGSGRPPGVLFGASVPVRLAFAAALIGALLTLVSRLIDRERGLGRFAPLVPLAEIDQSWIAKNVTNVRPEVVGAAWDDSTSAPEVAATLARLVSEGKLSSRVESRGRSFLRRDVLHLKLEVHRADFLGYELELVEALFSPGQDTTDTDRVRRRYAKTGFDPAELIRAALALEVNSMEKGTADKPSRRPTAMLFIAAIAVLVVAAITRPTDAGLVFGGFFAAIVIYLFALIQAALWRRRAYRAGAHAWRFAGPVALGAVLLLVQLLNASTRASALVFAGLTLVGLALANSVFNAAKSRQSAERIAIRKRLAAGREYFRRELRKPQPRLRDEWFPWALAFGLGRDADKWFRAFGGEARTLATAPAFGDSPHSPSGAVASSSASWTGFGGGGGFAGGGASGSFAAAAGAMAASVPAPSSSGSSSGGGGGGGGGGSSGGGGGGGW